VTKEEHKEKTLKKCCNQGYWNQVNIEELHDEIWDAAVESERIRADKEFQSNQLEELKELLRGMPE
jgi:hypothetical protein